MPIRINVWRSLPGFVCSHPLLLRRLIAQGTGRELDVMAAGTLLHWWIPAHWVPWLVVAGAVLSIPLQIIWFTGWAIFPILVDVALLWAIFGQHLTVGSLRA